MGYLVLLRFRDEDILNVNRSQDVMSPVVFEALQIGPHQVIVFPIMGESGIIGTSVLYLEMTEVPTIGPPLINQNTTTSAGNTETAVIMLVVGR